MNSWLRSLTIRTIRKWIPSLSCCMKSALRNPWTTSFNALCRRRSETFSMRPRRVTWRSRESYAPRERPWMCSTTCVTLFRLGTDRLDARCSWWPPRCGRFLLASGARVSAMDRGAGDVKHGRQPLHYTMRCKNLAVAEVLLDARVNPNAVSHLGFTRLSVAIEEDNADAIALLLKRGAEVKLKPRSRRYSP
jgi:hypothetical protein